MKTRIIYLAALMMTMFVLSACNNEDELSSNDNENFPEISEEYLNKSITMIELPMSLSENSNLEYHSWNKLYKFNYECYYSLNEVKASPYASNIDLLPEIDWEKQTLVIVYIHHSNSLDKVYCNIYQKSDKYLINCTAEGSFMDLESSRGMAIILNETKLSKKNISIKLTTNP